MNTDEVFERFKIRTPVEAIANGATGVVCSFDRNTAGTLLVFVTWDASGITSLCHPNQIKPK